MDTYSTAIASPVCSGLTFPTGIRIYWPNTMMRMGVNYWGMSIFREEKKSPLTIDSAGAC